MNPKSLREALQGLLPPEELTKVRAFDIVGDIGILRLPEELLEKKHTIGEALLRVHRNLRTVLLQTSPVSGEYRTRELEVVAGEPRTETVHREGGCLFKVDLSKVYFSPRLSFDRMRIARQVREGEVVTNLFAGVGCYSIVIAKHSRASKIYSIDLNPDAYQYMCENVRLNRVGDRVVPILGDAREKAPTLEKADRVLMPLPERAREFLDTALAALKPGGVVHFYDFGNEPDPFSPSLRFLRGKIGEIQLLQARKLRSYAPKCYHIVLDFSVPKVRNFG
jgi:tRNA (guanine37-N1)-methyltransferase